MSKQNANRQILQIALPAIAANVTVPLLGLADTAIAGHLGNAVYIGAIALGSMLFSVCYGLFSFLRMGTSGLTAQAYGSGNTRETTLWLQRSLAVGLAIGLALILLQWPIINLCFALVSSSAQTEKLARLYFGICIWGAPPVMMLYGLNGWFIGMQNSRCPMAVAIGQNLMNIALSLVFVCLCGMKIEGIALGTLLSQYSGLAFALLLQRRLSCGRPASHSWRKLLERSAMRRFFGINRDIFLRTLCLMAVMACFTSAGAASGDVTLAANSLLMQMFLLFSYFTDGFANAGEALCGRYMGAGNAREFRATTARLMQWGLALALLFAAAYAIGGRGFLGLLTNQGETLRAAVIYLPWVAAIPLVSVWSFVFDGICVGTTASGVMLRSVFVGAVAFFCLWLGLRPVMGNHALWLAFNIYLAARGAVEAACYPRIEKSVSASA